MLNEFESKMKSYDYAHRQGVKEIAWDEFAAMSARLAEELDKAGVEVIVGIARAGLFPATAVACSLRRELYPVRVTRRVNDEVTYASPVWKVPVSPEVSGKVVAVVDEITDTGETLVIAAQAVLERGAVRVVTACLVSHTWANPAPDVCALVSDALVIFPWDRRVLMGGEWRPHPEIVAALKAQGVEYPHP
jgi:hypoxanthine phosphoribosyltransferase